MTSSRRSNDGSPLEVEPSTAGATGGGDHGMGKEIIEYGLLYSSGGYLLKNQDPEVEKIYSAADWAKNHIRTGGHVFRRKVIVIEDWEEME